GRVPRDRWLRCRFMLCLNTMARERTGPTVSAVSKRARRRSASRTANCFARAPFGQRAACSRRTFLAWWQKHLAATAVRLADVRFDSMCIGSYRVASFLARGLVRRLGPLLDGVIHLAPSFLVW